MDSTIQFSALLRQHRVAAGLTQEALAERAGLSVHGVQKLERGATHPYRDTAERLLSALSLQPHEAEQLRATVEKVRRRGSAPRQGADPWVRHNLPVSLTSFLGRDQELLDILEELKHARLLTLTGVGGSGKTRLAIESARTVVDQFEDGAWLVELAQVTDPALVAHRLGAIIGVSETPDRPIVRLVVEALRNGQVLLVLDNCEHVLDASATLVDVLLRECPTLRILATSREPIGIQGEVSWTVPPLALPEAAVSTNLTAIERSPAVRLLWTAQRQCNLALR